MNFRKSFTVCFSFWSLLRRALCLPPRREAANRRAASRPAPRTRARAGRHGRSRGALGRRRTPPFHIQLWDAQKTSWEDAQLRFVAESGFTVIQNGWGGAYIPSQQLLDKVASYGLLYGAYVSTRQLFYDRATAAERAAVLPATNFDGTVDTGDFNTFDPVYQAVVAREMAREMAKVTDSRALLKVMFNSEHGAPVSYDSLTWQRAAEAGVVAAGQKLPYYYRGIVRVPDGESALVYAGRYAFARWFDTEAGDRVVNRLAADAVRTAAPGVCATADPNMDVYAYGQYRGMDVLQDWLRVHQAPRDPLSVAYRAERLKAHVRARSDGAGQIWIGPQLGTKTPTTQYGAPADVFEEALWLAAGFGANSVTCWGYDTVDFTDPLDQDLWSRVGKFKSALETQYPQLVGAVDAARPCAVLLSKANLALTRRAYYEIDDCYENFYRILLTAHVPADMLYDDDVLAGKLSGYKALLLPGIEYLTPELDSGDKGVRVEGRARRALPVHKRLLPRLPDHEGRVQRDDQHPRPRQPVASSAPVPRVAPLSRREDICPGQGPHGRPVRQSGCDRQRRLVRRRCYVVCVNDSRTYGAWTTARGYRWCEDTGRAGERDRDRRDRHIGAQVLRKHPGGGHSAYPALSEPPAT